MDESRSHIKSDILLRVRLLYAVFILIALLVFGRLIWVQWFSSEVRHNAARLSERIFSEVRLSAHRGQILSRHGETLSSSLFRYHVEFDFGARGLDSIDVFHEQADSLSQLLAAFFKDRTSAQYRAMFRREHNRSYVLKNEYEVEEYRSEGWFNRMIDRLRGEPYIRRKAYDTVRNHRPVRILPRAVDYAEWRILKEYPLLNWNMGMVYRLVEEDARIYPFGDLAGRTIGSFMQGDTCGLEMAYLDELKGRDGKALRQRIARDFYGRVAGGIEEPQDGLTLHTTLDMELQDVADRILRRQMMRNEAMWGTTVVMDVATGEVLAMVNLQDVGNGRFCETKNYALSALLEPGSTFKLATLITLLEDADFPPSKVYDTGDGKAVQVAKIPVRDTHRGKTADLKEALTLSSNVYFAKAVEEYYASKHKHQQYSDFLAKRLHLGERVGFGRMGEREPIIAGDWSKVRDPNVKLVKMAYGYRVMLTPIQILTLYNAVANHGRMIAPILVQGLSHDGDWEQRFEAREIESKICSNRTLHLAQSYLRNVALHGTGRLLFGDSTRFDVACKTGTAEITSPEGRLNDDYLASMVAYFPTEKPRYSIITSIATRHAHRKRHHGASLAGPVVRDLVLYLQNRGQKTFEPTTHAQKPRRLKGGSVEALNEVSKRLSLGSLPKQGTWARSTVDSLFSVRLDYVAEHQGRVPDVRGMGLKDALFLLERCGLQVRVVGCGAVSEQSIAPNSPLKGHRSIQIILK